MKSIEKIKEQVKQKLQNESSGHDWWHVYRVWKMAKKLAKDAECDVTVVELAALLHDIADWKNHDGDDTVGPREAKKIMLENNVPEEICEHVCEIILNMSFKGAGVVSEMKSVEGKIVQDADRLDAIGAIGIARAFAYGGNKNRQIHDPEKTPVLHSSKEEYIKNSSATINHFYEKLLLLKERMNTKAAQKIAEKRHLYMEKFLKRFYSEWEGRL